jgi:hypothetical protein
LSTHPFRRLLILPKSRWTPGRALSKMVSPPHVETRKTLTEDPDYKSFLESLKMPAEKSVVEVSSRFTTYVQRAWLMIQPQSLNLPLHLYSST